MDGNLTADSEWVYAWDAENRLVSMGTLQAAYDMGVSRKKLEFVYDSLGRRVQKKVSYWDTSTEGFVLDATTLYLYDGWNLIYETSSVGTETVDKTYAWGLDLSGSLQGAGGSGWSGAAAGFVGGAVGAATFNPALGAVTAAGLSGTLAGVTAGALSGAAGGLAGGLVQEGFDAADPCDEFSFPDLGWSIVGGVVGGAIGGGFMGKSGYFNPSNADFPLGAQTLSGFNSGIYIGNGLSVTIEF